MKVLLCSPYEPVIKENAGGIAVWAKNVMEHHAKVGGADVRVLPYNRSIYVHDGLNRLVRMYKGAKDYLGLMWQTRCCIKKEKYDVLHLCSSALMSILRDYIVMRMARRNGVAGVLHFHCGRIPGLAKANNWRWKVLKKAVAQASAVIVLDEMSYKVLKDNGFDNVYKVPNPLSADMMRDIEAGRGKCSRVPRRLLFVGHVLPSKGVNELVEACASIPDVELRIVGRAEKAVSDELMRAASVKDGEWMHLLGEKAHEEVLREMQECDMFLFPSYTEGFPNVIIEAMACGTPIVTTGVGAIPEMLDTGDGRNAGVIVPVRDAVALREAVIGLMDDDGRKKEFSRLSVQRVNDAYAVGIVWEQLLSIWGNAAHL